MSNCVSVEWSQQERKDGGGWREKGKHPVEFTCWMPAYVSAWRQELQSKGFPATRGTHQRMLPRMPLAFTTARLCTSSAGTPSPFQFPLPCFRSIISYRKVNSLAPHRLHFKAGSKQRTRRHEIRPSKSAVSTPPVSGSPAALLGPPSVTTVHHTAFN